MPQPSIFAIQEPVISVGTIPQSVSKIHLNDHQHSLKIPQTPHTSADALSSLIKWCETSKSGKNTPFLIELHSSIRREKWDAKKKFWKQNIHLLGTWPLCFFTSLNPAERPHSKHRLLSTAIHQYSNREENNTARA